MPRKKLLPETTPEEEIRPTIDQVARLNPEFREPMSPRAQKLYDAIFRDESGARLPSRKIASNVVETRIRLGSMVEQLEQNRLWLELLAKADEYEAENDGRPSRVAATEQEFAASARTIYKTLQEVLSGIWKVAVDRKTATSMKQDMSILNIDLELMNDTLLKNLGLNHLIPAKGLRKAKKMEAYRMALPMVKEVLSRLEMIALPHEALNEECNFSRMTRIPAGPREGLILGTKGTGIPDDERKIVFGISLDDAISQDADIHQRYREEIVGLVAEIEAVLADIDRKVSTGWKQLKGSPELVEMQESMKKIKKKLAHVKNEHKIDARELVDRSSTFKAKRTVPGRYSRNDKGERYLKSEPREVEFDSPGAMRAMWNKARREIGKRIKQIGSIGGKLSDHATSRLAPLKEKQVAPFKEFFNDFLANHKSYKIMNGEVTKENAPALIANLRNLKEKFLSEVKFQPYLTIARLVAGHLEAAAVALEKDPLDGKNSAEELTKAFVAAKMARFHVEMRLFYDEHLTSSVSHKKPYFLGMLDALEDIRKQMERTRVNPSKKICPKGVKTPEYDHAFACMKDLLADLIAKAKDGKALVKGSRNNPDPMLEKAIRDVRGEMYARFGEFDLVEILKEDLQVNADAPLPESMQVQQELEQGQGSYGRS